MKLKISPGFCALVCLLGWVNGKVCLCFLIGILLHECGHLFLAKLLGVSVDGIAVQAGGAVIHSCNLNYRQELFVAMAGPFVSFLAAVVGKCISGQFAAVSLLLGAVNLLPVYPMDGGRILRSALCLLLSVERAQRIVKITAYIICGGLMIGACWMTTVLRWGLWPIFAALIILCRVGNASMNG